MRTIQVLHAAYGPRVRTLGLHDDQFVRCKLGCLDARWSAVGLREQQHRGIELAGTDLTEQAAAPARAQPEIHARIGGSDAVERVSHGDFGQGVSDTDAQFTGEHAARRSCRLNVMQRAENAAAALEYSLTVLR